MGEAARWKGSWYLEAGAADELDPVTAPEGRDLRRVVAGEADPTGVGYGGGCGPDGRVGGEERRRRDRDGNHGWGGSSRGHFTAARGRELQRRRGLALSCLSVTVTVTVN
jgi:hypothetical protein